MQNLKTLRVRCVHTHKDGYSGPSYEPGNEDGVLPGMVKSLTYYTTSSWKEVYIVGMFFEHGDLLKMVKTRKREGEPLETLYARCLPLPADECATLHKMLNFHHVRNKEETPPPQQTPCGCS